jgi:glycine/D-amino acid oxidase-like deaminating enzyme
VSTKSEKKSADIVIIGAGVIGSSVTMGLAQLGGPGVCLVDFDLEGSLSSSELNAGGVRATFNQAINIEASKISIEYFSSIATEIGFRECGYLWLCTEDQLRLREAQLPLWNQFQWPVDVLSREQIQARYPILDRLDGVSAALFGKRDGLLNPNLLKLHYRQKAKSAGADFLDRRLFKFGKKNPVTQKWELTFYRYSENLNEEEKREVLSGSTAIPYVEEVITTDVVVNCAGAWAGFVARGLGYETKSTPVRRQISLFDCRGDYSAYGMIVDTSGVYFHPESTFFLSGVAEKNELPGVNFKYGGDDFFQEKIWSPLSERSSHFEQIKHISGWAGLYEVSPDESAIIGEARPGVFEAHSFSGHGVMHSYCVGISLAERIIRGRYESFDFSSLTGERFQSGNEIPETAVI